MSPTGWDDTKERRLLLQLLTLHPIQMSVAEWELIARKWDNGNKPNSFRMHFAKLKAEGEAMMDEDVGGLDGGIQSAVKGRYIWFEIMLMVGGKQRSQMEGEGNVKERAKRIKKKQEEGSSDDTS
jgi:hypothetical protein